MKLTLNSPVSIFLEFERLDTVYSQEGVHYLLSVTSWSFSPNTRSCQILRTSKLECLSLLLKP